MHIDTQKSRLKTEETPTEKALRVRVEQLEATVAELKKNQVPPELKIDHA